MFAAAKHQKNMLALLAGCFLFIGAGLNDGQAAVSSDSSRTKQILSLFEDISQVPRCSKDEERIAAWLVAWAEQRNLAVESDEHNNVLITVPASPGYEDRPGVVLQAHMDMVCQKVDGSPHDFRSDPISLVREGDWLRAKDTTLGADDGIGVAIALALAEDPPAAHPRLELLFTTDEEIDATGAAGLASDFFTGTRLINLDSEVEGAVTLGAAGGIKLDISLPLTFSGLPEDLQVYSLRVEGLLGGHSGMEIHKDRANANILIAQALSPVPFRMIDYMGGTADNAITPSSEILLAVAPTHVKQLEERIATFELEARRRHPDETGLSITLRATNPADEALSDAGSTKVVELITRLPQGVTAWSTEFTGLPETSNNVGVVRIANGILEVTAFPRSFSAEELEEIAQRIEALVATSGATSVRRSRYPVWRPDPGSTLYTTAIEVYQRLFNTPLRTEVLHAGLETGYFAEQNEALDIISIGPTVEHVHTPRERLDVPSVDRLARFLEELLGEL
jgi:dipeptidase D